VAPPVAVGRRHQRVAAVLLRHPADRLGRDAGRVNQEDDDRVDVRRLERFEASTEGRSHPGLPAPVLDHSHVAELGLRPYLGRGSAEHHEYRRAAPARDRGDGPFHEQAALMADQCLGSAVPASSAGGQHKTCDAQLGAPLDE
jgi:hypothetical protein